jgi:hypothetical protein
MSSSRHSTGTTFHICMSEINDSQPDRLSSSCDCVLLAALLAHNPVDGQRCELWAMFRDYQILLIIMLSSVKVAALGN